MSPTVKTHCSACGSGLSWDRIWRRWLGHPWACRRLGEAPDAFAPEGMPSWP